MIHASTVAHRLGDHDAVAEIDVFKLIAAIYAPDREGTIPAHLVRF